MKLFRKKPKPTKYKSLTVKDYQIIYPILRKSITDYMNQASIYDMQELASTVLNIPYEDVIDLPAEEIEKLQWLINEPLTKAIEQKNQIVLFGKEINHVKLFSQVIVTGQAQNFEAILKQIENPLKTAEVREQFYDRPPDENGELTEASKQFIEDVFEGRIMQMHKLAAIFLQPIWSNSKFNAAKVNELAELLLNENVHDVCTIMFFFA